MRYWPDGRRETSEGRGRGPADRGQGLGSPLRTGSACTASTRPVESGSPSLRRDDEECTAGTWHRWDGQRWSPADAPDPFTSAQEHVVSGEGIGWAPAVPRSADRDRPILEGDVVPIATRPRMGSLRPCPVVAHACSSTPTATASTASAIVCYDPDGEIARHRRHGPGLIRSQFSISPRTAPSGFSVRKSLDSRSSCQGREALRRLGMTDGTGQPGSGRQPPASVRRLSRTLAQASPPTVTHCGWARRFAHQRVRPARIEWMAAIGGGGPVVGGVGVHERRDRAAVGCS